MKVGDLVEFKNCSEQGKVGVVVICPPPQPKIPEGSWVYRVSSNGKEALFTGSQLKVVS